MMKIAKCIRKFSIGYLIGLGVSSLVMAAIVMIEQKNKKDEGEIKDIQEQLDRLDELKAMVDDLGKTREEGDHTIEEITENFKKYEEIVKKMKEEENEQ